MTQGQFAMVGAIETPQEKAATPSTFGRGQKGGVAEAARKASVSHQTMTKAFLVRDYAIAGADR